MQPSQMARQKQLEHVKLTYTHRQQEKQNDMIKNSDRATHV